MMINAQKSSGKCPINDTTASDTRLSQYLLVDLNARNAPGACPYCNRQPLKKNHGSNETAKIFVRIYF